MDSGTESVGSAGRRSHHSLEDALEMDLEPVGEVGPDVENGVSVVSGQDELVSLEEPVFEVPTLRDTSPKIRAGYRWMDTVDVEELFRSSAPVLRSVPRFSPRPVPSCVAHSFGRSHCHRTCPPSTRVENVSLATQDDESPSERRSCEEREIAITLRTLQRWSMAGVVGGQREDCRRSEQCDASTQEAGECR